MAKLAVYFPGIGYHCDKPLLYYGRKTACEQGYQEYRNIQYAYHAGNIRGNAEKMKEAYEVLFSQTEAALADMVGMIMRICSFYPKASAPSSRPPMQRNMD